VAEDVAQEISVKLIPRKKPGPVNPEAYIACLQGRGHWNQRTEPGLKKSLEYLRFSVERDPSYALAHAWLADAYNLIGYYGILPPEQTLPLAKVEAESAIRLDDTLAEAHAARADVAYYEFDWRTAEREYKHAILRNPNYAAAHQWYAAFLSVHGRVTDASEQIAMAYSLEPRSIAIRTDMAVEAYSARRYDLAISYAKEALVLDPSSPQAHLWLALPLLAQGNYSPAIDEFEKVVTLSGGNPLYRAFLGAAYGRAGRRSEALNVLHQLQQVAGERRVAPEAFSLVYIGLGDNDQVFAWADQAYAQRSGILARIKVEPILDPVRPDPRFAALLQRLGFQPDK